jgi:hypothetical protein
MGTLMVAGITAVVTVVVLNVAHSRECVGRLRLKVYYSIVLIITGCLLYLMSCMKFGITIANCVRNSYLKVSARPYRS